MVLSLAPLGNGSWYIIIRNELKHGKGLYKEMYVSIQLHVQLEEP